MSQFLLKMLIPSIIGHAFVFFRLHRAFGESGWIVPVGLWFTAMAFCPLIMWVMTYSGSAYEIMAWIYNSWLPFCLCLLILFLLTDLVRGVMALLDLFMPDGRKRRKLRYQNEVLFGSYKRRAFPLQAVLVVALSLGLCAYSVYEAYDVRPVHYSMRTSKLPPDLLSPPLTGEAGRLRIAFVTDIHLNALIGPEYLQRVITCVRARNPDLILLGGDTLDTAAIQERTEELRLLKELKAPLGKFAVLGNHDGKFDPEAAGKFLQEAGFTVLRRESALIAPSGAFGRERLNGLEIVGVDDPRIADQEGTRNNDPMPLLRASLKERGEGARRFVILLDHRPRLRTESIGLFDLQLSGHTHGGQIWPAKFLMQSIYGTTNGWSDHKNSQGESSLLVSAGTGFAKMPMRFLIPPEVAIVDLVSNGD